MKAAIISLSIVLAFPATVLAQDLTALSASEAAAKIRKGEITSEAFTKALIDKAKAGKSLNAFITLDEEGALRAAKAADAAAKAKKWKGPLHGVPLVLKDNIHVAGLPNTAGTPGMKGFVPKESAPVAKKLIAAGASFLAKPTCTSLLSASPVTTPPSGRSEIPMIRSGSPEAPLAVAGRRSPRAWRPRAWGRIRADRCAYRQQ